MDPPYYANNLLPFIICLCCTSSRLYVLNFILIYEPIFLSTDGHLFEFHDNSTVFHLMSINMR